MNNVEEEAIRILIERHKEEFENLRFQKKKELEAFGGFSPKIFFTFTAFEIICFLECFPLKFHFW